jgi:hypothetical protein
LSVGWADTPHRLLDQASDNKHDGQEKPTSQDWFVALPGHPLYSHRVQVTGSRSTKTYTLCAIEDPAHPGFHYQIPERWLSSSAPPPAPTPTPAHGPICLTLPALDRMIQMILIKDQTGRAKEDDQPVERDDCPDLGSNTTSPQGAVGRTALLPGAEAGRRDSP